MPSNLVALLSDLGEKDYFVGAMKGVILSINPDARTVDVTHQIPKHDIRTAAFTLLEASKTFPPETNFIVVVDPGVGTERKCILLRTPNKLNFIGPDNGVFTLIVNQLGVEEIREISNKELMRPQVSPTFHGRDIMAPVAAHLSSGLDPSEVGSKVKEFKLLEIQNPELRDDELHGQVIHIDNFGNLVTNIDASTLREFADLGTPLKIKINDSTIETRLVKTFADVARGEVLCCIGSADLLEIAKNQESLARDLNVGLKTKVILKRLG